MNQPIGKVFKMVRSSDLMNALNIVVLEFSPELLFSNPGILPTLALKSPKAMRENPAPRQIPASETSMEYRSTFH